MNHSIQHTQHGRTKSIFSPGFGVILFIMLALIASVSLVLSQRDLRSKATSTKVNLLLLPTTQTVRTNQTVELQINMNTSGLEVSAARIKIGYNPNYVKVNSISPKSVLPVLLGQPKIESNSVTADLSSLCDAVKCYPFKGNDTVAILNFTTLEKPGVILFEIYDYNSGQTKVAVIGQESTNQLGTVTSASVTITAQGASGGPSPSLAITPVVTPTPSSGCTSPTQNTPTAICNSDGTARVTWIWEEVSGATQYELQYDESSTFSSPVTVTSSTKSYTLVSMTDPQTTRYSRVRVKTSGSSCTSPSSWSSTKTIVTTCGTCNIQCLGGVPPTKDCTCPPYDL